MEEILHQLVGSLSHHLQRFYMRSGAGFLPSTVDPSNTTPPKFQRLACKKRILSFWCQINSQGQNVKLFFRAFHTVVFFSGKTHLEPENRLFEQGNHLPNSKSTFRLIIFWGSMIACEFSGAYISWEPKVPPPMPPPPINKDK